MSPCKTLLTNPSQASAPVAVLITSWIFRVERPRLKTFFNVLIIGFGIALASFGEVKFSWIGFFYQAGSVFSESIKVIMIQILLSREGQKMDPLVSLYYYAPVCTVMNFLVTAAMELSTVKMDDVWHAGVFMLLLNAAVAFLLNVASVFLVRITSLLPPGLFEETTQSRPFPTNNPPDRQNLRPSNDPRRRLQKHPPRPRLRHILGHHHHAHATFWLLHRDRRTHLLRCRLRWSRNLLRSHFKLCKEDRRGSKWEINKESDFGGYNLLPACDRCCG
jgi:hypothetical protein